MDWLILAALVAAGLVALVIVRWITRHLSHALIRLGGPFRWLGHAIWPLWNLITLLLMVLAAVRLFGLVFTDHHAPLKGFWFGTGVLTKAGGLALVAAVVLVLARWIGRPHLPIPRGRTPRPERGWLGRIGSWLIWPFMVAAGLLVGPRRVLAFVSGLFLVLAGPLGVFTPDNRSMIWWEEGAVLTSANAAPDRVPCNRLHLRFATSTDEGQYIGVPTAQCVRVHYATPRVPVTDGRRRITDFGKTLDPKVKPDSLHLGYADVSLPLPVDYDKAVGAGDAVYNRDRLEYLKDAAWSQPEKACASATSNDEKARCEWQRLSRFAFVTDITAQGTSSQLTEDFRRSLRREIDHVVPAYCAASLDREVCRTPRDEQRRSVLLFVHGFNQTFEDTLVRVAQLALDLDLSPEGAFDVTYGVDGDTIIPRRPTMGFGAPILFTWPNGESQLSYAQDRGRAVASAAHLRALLVELAADDQIDDINIVVHSMGHRVFIQQIEDFAASYLAGVAPAPDGRLKRIRIVHAAGDVSDDAYDELMGKADVRFDDRRDQTHDDQLEDGIFPTRDEPYPYPQVTIYKSNKDWALITSSLLKGWRERLGLIKPILVGQIPTIHHQRYMSTINVRGPSMDLMGHGYYSSDGNILNDMACFMKNDPDEMPFGIMKDRAIAPRLRAPGYRYYDLYGGRQVQTAPRCRPVVAPLVVASLDAMPRLLGYSYAEFARQRTAYLIERERCITTPVERAFFGGVDDPDLTSSDLTSPAPAVRGNVPARINTSDRLACLEDSEEIIAATKDEAIADDLREEEGADTDRRDPRDDLPPDDVIPPPSATLIEDATIYFPLDSAMLVCEARAQLKAVAEFAETHDVIRIEIEGHTDTAGEAERNVDLSYERALVVERHLKRVLGVTVPIFDVVPRGETTPAEITGDGVREQRNRRVELIIEYIPAADQEGSGGIPSIWNSRELSGCPESLFFSIPRNRRPAP